MSQEICYPQEETWWIAFISPAKTSVISYDVFQTDECLYTYWDTLEMYTVKQQWIDRLEEYGITPIFPPK
jgi:hypothetical protein